MEIFTFKIIKHLATLHTSKGNWTKELNIVKWNDNEPKYDIREWSPDHKRMTGGFTISTDEMDIIKRALENL